jgi:hypothetical protein
LLNHDLDAELLVQRLGDFLQPVQPRATRTRERPCAAYWRANSSPKPLDAPVMRTQDLSGVFISFISKEGNAAG